MKFCPECGEKLENDNFKFCPECGYKFESDSNNSNTKKSGGFVSSFIKRVRDEIPDEYVDKIKNNETVDEIVETAKIIWRGDPNLEDRKENEDISQKREEYKKKFESQENKKIDNDVKQGLKNCPNCGKQIPKIAIRCKYCKTMLKTYSDKSSEALTKITNKEIEKSETPTIQKTDEADYGNLGLSDLQETLIKSLPVINNPLEYEENIIKKYAESNSEERKELLKDCWTITKLAKEHDINRQEVQKAILTDEFLNKDLIGVFKVNPKNIRSLKILYRKTLAVPLQKEETSDEIKGDIFQKPIINENIGIVEKNEVKDSTVEKTVETSQEESTKASDKLNRNNKKKKRKGIMNFTGKDIINKLAEKNDEMVAEQNREIREKVQPLFPEYAKMLNTSSDNLYVASVRVYSYVKGTKSSYTQFDRQIFIMTLKNNNIAYIPFAHIVRDKIRYFESRDMLSISFKNISSISNKRIGYIELEMNGDNSFAIETKDLFGKQINNGFLEKYNNFIANSTVEETNSSSESTNNADELLKYAELYKQGLLTEEEFEAKKKELL